MNDELHRELLLLAKEMPMLRFGQLFYFIFNSSVLPDIYYIEDAKLLELVKDARNRHEVIPYSSSSSRGRKNE